MRCCNNKRIHSISRYIRMNAIFDGNSFDYAIPSKLYRSSILGGNGRRGFSIWRVSIINVSLFICTIDGHDVVVTNIDGRNWNDHGVFRLS